VVEREKGIGLRHSGTPIVVPSSITVVEAGAGVQPGINLSVGEIQGDPYVLVAVQTAGSTHVFHVWVDGPVLYVEHERHRVSETDVPSHSERCSLTMRPGL
jgi:hypothetical protein